MPKPALVDRNGWEHIILSQHPVYQVTHWRCPNRIPDPTEMTKPRSFPVPEKLLHVHAFENEVCGPPLPRQWTAHAGNPLHDTAVFSPSSIPPWEGQGDIWRQQQPLLCAALRPYLRPLREVFPGWRDCQPQKTILWGPELSKLPVAEGNFFHEWCQGKALLSSPVKQSLGKTLGMTQPGIL